jgi:hypothetical protein
MKRYFRELLDALVIAFTFALPVILFFYWMTP